MTAINLADPSPRNRGPVSVACRGGTSCDPAPSITWLGMGKILPSLFLPTFTAQEVLEV